MSCVGKHLSGIGFEHLHIPLPDGPIELPCLTEPAPSDTAALNLQNHPVLGYLDKRNHGLVRIVGVGYIHHQFFANDIRCFFIQFPAFFDGPVFLIDFFIEPGHIDAGNPGGAF